MAEIQDEVAQFLKLDDDLKRAKKQMKAVRDVIKRNKEHIVTFMVRNGVDRLTGLKGGTQYIECSQKTLKKRATMEQQLTKLHELIGAGVMDPEKLMEGITTCGGTYTEYRISRRTRRPSAKALVEEALAAAGASAAAGPGARPLTQLALRQRKDKKKKRKLAMTESAVAPP